MQRFVKNILGTALVALVPTAAMASSHREAPAISNHPSADNTDLYAWVTPGTHDKLIVLANYIPLEEPAGGPNFNSFSDDVRYEVHVYKGDNIHNDFATYQIDFNTTRPGRANQNDPAASPFNGLNFFSQISGASQTYKVTRIAQNGQKTVIANNIPVAPVNIGPRTDAVAYSPAAPGTPIVYNDAFAATFIRNTSEGGRVFAGPRDDGFYVDLGGVFDLANLRPNGQAQDGVSGFNTHTIALEIPLTTIFGGTLPSVSNNNSIVSVWASASRRKVSILKNNGEIETSGPFVQVSRLGQPLINEAVIGLQDKDRWIALEPEDDVRKFAGYFDNPVIVRDANAVGIYASLQPPIDPVAAGLDRGRAGGILNIISLTGGGVALTDLGDVLRVDVTKDSAYPNGRALQGSADVLGHPRAADQENGDVTDILLNVLLAANPAFGISDGVQHNDKNFLTTFPFLALPWRGFDEGHGKPTAN